MSSKPEFVQIEPDEDVASVKDRLAFLRGQRVLLIWPETGTALSRKLDLVLIQREAMRRAIRLAIVTHDATVIKHANELNISTFGTIGASERGRWKRGRSKVFANRFQRPNDSIDPEELEDVASRTRAIPVNRSLLWTIGTRLALFMLLLAVIFAIGYVFLPESTVYVMPAQQSEMVEVPIIADPNRTSREVDVENGLIPTITLSIQVEDTQNISTTGVQDRDDLGASGTVIFANITTNQVTIPAGTQVSTGSGTPIVFRTLTEAIVPAGNGEETEVAVEALPSSAGTIGNVGVNLINTVIGPLEDVVNVVNRAPMSGGENRSVRVVSQQDIDVLVNLTRQQLQTLAFVEMESLLTPSQFIVDETIRIVEERADNMQFSADIGDITDTLSLWMRVRVEAEVIDEEFAQRIVFAYLSNQIPRGRVIDPESILYSRGAMSVDGVTQTISFTMSGSANIRGQIDTELLRERLAGLSLDDAFAYLVAEVDIAEASLPRIDLSPAWFDRMPVLPMRIDVVVETP